MSWCMKKRFLRHDLYDEKGTKVADIHILGRHAGVVSDKKRIWKIHKSSSSEWKIMGLGGEYFAKIQSNMDANKLVSPLESQVTLKINKEVYRMEQSAWLDIKIYRDQEKIGEITRSGRFDRTFTIGAENNLVFLLAALTVLWQHEEQSLLSAYCR